MKFTQTKKDKNTSSIRKVWNNEKKVCFGLVGTIEDFLKEGILKFCDYPKESWAFIPAPGIMLEVTFGSTKKEAIKNIPNI